MKQEEIKHLKEDCKIKLAQQAAPTFTLAVKDILWLLKSQNAPLEACKEILNHLDDIEDKCLTAQIIPQWNVDFVRNTLQNAIVKAESEE